MIMYGELEDWLEWKKTKKVPMARMEFKHVMPAFERPEIVHTLECECILVTV
jgi:hypothetical protein